MSIPTHAPDKIRKKDTIKWTFDAGDYTPDTYTLTYYFTNASGTVTIVATDNGDGTFLVTISKTASDSFSVGWYRYIAKVTNTVGGAEVYTVDEGQIIAEDDLEGAYDSRSQVKKDIDAIEAMLTGKLSAGDAASFTISSGGMSRAISRIPFSELEEILATRKQQYRAELKAERMAKGQEPGNRIKARFC